MTCKICGRPFSLGDDPVVEYLTCHKCRAVLKLLFDHTITTYPGRTGFLYITCDKCDRIIGLILDPNSVTPNEAVTTCNKCVSSGGGALHFEVTKYRDITVDGKSFHVFPCPKCKLEIYYDVSPGFSYPQGLTCTQSPNQGCGAWLYPKFIGKPQ